MEDVVGGSPDDLPTAGDMGEGGGSRDTDGPQDLLLVGGGVWRYVE